MNTKPCQPTCGIHGKDFCRPMSFQLFLHGRLVNCFCMSNSSTRRSVSIEDLSPNANQAGSEGKSTGMSCMFWNVLECSVMFWKVTDCSKELKEECFCQPFALCALCQLASSTVGCV